jgi:acetyl esterase/lipase
MGGARDRAARLLCTGAARHSTPSARLTPGDVAGVIAMGCVLAPLEETLSTRSLDEFRAQWAARSRPDRTFATADELIESDPSRFIGRHMPPTLVICAEAERFFPAILEQGAKFVRRLLDLDRPADLVIVPGRHMTSIQSITEPGNPAFRAVKAFIDARESGLGALDP